MKKSIWAGALALALILLTIIANRRETMHASEKILKIALSGEIPEGRLSPENISTIALYHLHSNIWDTLITSDQTAAVAKSFKVSSDNLKFSFSIDEEARFSNGRPITSADVKAAFERLMAREENGHINAKSVIRKITASSPTDLTIELIAPTPSFLYLLTTPEFGIVPRESTDNAGEVVDLTVTSGAYTVTGVDAKHQVLRLVRNKFFRRAVENAPAEIELTFIRDIGATSDSEKLFRHDLIEVRSSDSEAAVSLAEKKGFAYKATVPSLSVFLVADTTNTSPEFAKIAAHAFQNEFQFETPRSLEKRSHQFFPEKTFGSLTAQEIPAIQLPSGAGKIPQEVVIRSSRDSGRLVEEVARTFKKIGAQVRFVSMASKEQAHYMFISQGMNTDFPEIELHLDILGPYADFNATDEIKDLVRLATHETDEPKRSEIIKKIGKEFLSSGKIIPITVRAYVHLFQPGKVDLNQITTYDGDMPFYKLKVL